MFKAFACFEPFNFFLTQENWEPCMPRNAFTYAMGAGAAGAIAAIASKFAFGEYSGTSHYEKFALSLIVFAVSNLLMWWAYTKSLSQADSTVQCMAVNTGTNFALTGILGYLLFSESHSIFWCFGLSLVFIGVCLLANDDKEKAD